jgi:1-deoxy-D-xylulose-5-phosphate reductoisomerase
MAQLGMPDMKLPIQYALYYPERRIMHNDKLDFYKVSNLTFEEPDMETFRGLKLAYEVGRAGGSLPTVYNAANERAVALFLDNKIEFLDIYRIIEECVDNHKNIDNPSLEQILKVEEETYNYIDNMKF